MGLIPRSILRTFNRFYEQLVSNTNGNVLYEFRISRYQTIAAVKCFINFICVPYLVHTCLQNHIIYPLMDRLLKHTNPQFTCNWLSEHSIGDEKYYIQLKNFNDQFFFEVLIQYKNELKLNHRGNPKQAISITHVHRPNSMNNEKLQNVLSYQYTIIQLAEQRYTQLLHLLSSVLSDCLTLILIWNLIIFSTPQLIILKSFLIESIYNLSDTTKSFLIILITDLLVGFHSSKGWELFLENFLFHFGFSSHKDFIFLVVSTFPVILDTIFKYWIFRYLNKISPSTVATYQNMIE